MMGNTRVNEAARVLYTSGMPARSEDEAELMKCLCKAAENNGRTK